MIRRKKKKQKLTMLDNALLITHSKNSPKFIGCLIIFEKPNNKDPKYVKKLYNFWMKANRPVSPFNLRLNPGFPISPHWVEDDKFIIEQHLHYITLPPNSDRKTLNKTAAKIHSETDFIQSRPLWTCTLIDGVSENRFAIYACMHHALIDGISGGRIMAASFTNSPRTKRTPPFWANAKSPYDVSQKKSKSGYFKKLSKIVGKNFWQAYGLGRISSQIALETVGLTKNAISIPFKAAPSILVGSVDSNERSLTTASISMDRISHLCKVTRNTINHIALTCLDTALHRYLEKIGHPLDSEILISMPVSLRKEDAKAGGNIVGMVPTKLSRKTDDPIMRLRDIGVSLQGVRNQIDASPASSIQAYSISIALVSQIMESARFPYMIPNMSHTIVSNVPGPAKTLYLEKSKLVEWYPISVLGPCHRMNITMFSYDGTLFFGIVVAKDALPQIGLLSEYIHEAFDDLENMVTSPDKGISVLEKRRMKTQVTISA